MYIFTRIFFKTEDTELRPLVRPRKTKCRKIYEIQ